MKFWVGLQVMTVLPTMPYSLFRKRFLRVLSTRTPFSWTSPTSSITTCVSSSEPNVSYSGSIGWNFMSISRIWEPLAYVIDAALLAVGVLRLSDAQQLVDLAEQRHDRRLLQSLQLLAAEADADAGVVAALEHHPDADDEALGSACTAAEEQLYNGRIMKEA